MGIIQISDMVGFRLLGKIYCPNCMSEGDYRDVDQNNVITADELTNEQAEGYRYYCDECGEMLVVPTED